jgi:hypothetical protein
VEKLIGKVVYESFDHIKGVNKISSGMIRGVIAKWPENEGRGFGFCRLNKEKTLSQVPFFGWKFISGSIQLLQVSSIFFLENKMFYH